jgi:hypothetical protein
MNSNSDPLNKNMLLFGLIVGLILFYMLDHYNETKNIPKPTEQTKTNLVVTTRVVDLADHNVFIDGSKEGTTFFTRGEVGFTSPGPRVFRGPDPRTVRRNNRRD